MKKYYILTVFIIITGLVLGFNILNKKFGFIQTEETAQRIYKQGLDDIEAGNLQNAYYNFSKISKFNSYYEPALFRQGLLATELNDNGSAVKAYETLLEKFPNTFFAEKSIYNLAVAYYNSSFKEKAYANFKLTIKKYPKSDYADAANYFLGVLTKDEDANTAAENFVNYIDSAPLGKYALMAVNELKNLNVEYNEKQNLSIGKTLLVNDKAQDSLVYLNNTNIEESWPVIFIAKKRLGDISSAKNVFEIGLAEYSKNNDELQKQAIDEFISLYGKNQAKGLKDAKIICDRNNCQMNDYIMYKLLPYVDKVTKMEYYNRIYNDFPQGDYAADALYNSLFNDYIKGSYDNAIIKAKKHISKYPDKKSSPAAIYWLAKSLEKKKNYIEANNYYSKVINNYKDTYYAYLANAKLNKLSNPYNLTNFDLISEKPVYIDIPIIHANLPINSSKKIDELVKVGDFKIFEYADFNNEIIKSWVAYYEGNITKASVIAEKVISEADVKPTFDDDIYKLIYPIAYADLINKNSGKDKNISPYLMLALINKESRFNPDAISSAGARGLMQIMPDTASYIAHLTNTRYNINDLFNPEYNIYLGTKYYEYIKKNYHSNDVYAIASYNGGHGSVSRWLNNIPAGDIDEFIEQIPYQETKDYIKQIYKNYWVYSCIYNSSRVR